MKLRIQDNSLRLRLTRPEVAELRRQGRVEAAIAFAPDAVLSYALESSPSAPAVSAAFHAARISVTLPQALANAWADSDQVSIGSPPGAEPGLLIEKDFQCLHKPGEADPDAYANPLARASG